MASSNTSVKTHSTISFRFFNGGFTQITQALKGSKHLGFELPSWPDLSNRVRTALKPGLRVLVNQEWPNPLLDRKNFFHTEIPNLSKASSENHGDGRIGGRNWNGHQIAWHLGPKGSQVCHFGSQNVGEHHILANQLLRFRPAWADIVEGRILHKLDSWSEKLLETSRNVIGYYLISLQNFDCPMDCVLKQWYFHAKQSIRHNLFNGEVGGRVAGNSSLTGTYP